MNKVKIITMMKQENSNKKKEELLGNKIEVTKIAESNDYKYAKEYIDDVASNKISACKWVKKAIKRHIKDLQRSKSDDFNYYFDEDSANVVLKSFNEYKHFKGKWAGQTFILLPWQQAILSILFGWLRKDTHLRRFRTAYLEMPRKTGKALALDTPILTTAGWATMADIKSGDCVYGADGKPTQVIAVSEIFNNDRCYKITFDDGSEIVADANHLWNVSDTDKYIYYLTYTSNIYKNFQSNKYKVPMTKPVEYEEKNLFIAPYSLGYWLGNGESATSRLYCDSRDINELLYYFNNDGYETYATKNSENCYSIYLSYNTTFRLHRNDFLNKLKIYDLINNKHIPDVYLQGSIQQRYELLKGLMDSDGCSTKEGSCIFSQKRKNIVDSFCELLSSLGIKYTITTQIFSNSKEGEYTFYYVHFYTIKSNPCFKLTRKIARLKDYVTERTNIKRIVDIKEVETVPTKCITVSSSDGLFLAGKSLTVTHNSTLAGGVGLYTLDADGESAAEVYSVATTAQQARIVFETAKNMVKSSKHFKKHAQLFRDAIVVPDTVSSFKPLASESTTLDGLNISACINDKTTCRF